MRNIRNNKGFTLIELMIVVVIIGILAAIAIPKFSNVGNSAKEKEAEGIAKQMYTLGESFRVKYGSWPTTKKAFVDSASFQMPSAKHYDTTKIVFDLTKGSVCLLPTTSEKSLRAVAIDTLGRVAYSADVGTAAACPAATDFK